MQFNHKQGILKFYISSNLLSNTHAKLKVLKYAELFMKKFAWSTLTKDQLILCQMFNV